MERLRERTDFLAAFLKQPFRTASITPSSESLARMMVTQMELAKADLVVELGPGTGVFTRAIERELRPAARLVCMEINKDFARRLAADFPRAQVVNDSAEHLELYLRPHGLMADCVISGLPWVLLSSEEQRRLLDPVVRSLRPGGGFSTFAYAHAAWLPAGRRFRGMLEASFRRVEVSAPVFRNLPPALVYRCRL